MLHTLFEESNSAERRCYWSWTLVLGYPPLSFRASCFSPESFSFVSTALGLLVCLASMLCNFVPPCGLLMQRANLDTPDVMPSTYAPGLRLARTCSVVSTRTWNTSRIYFSSASGFAETTRIPYTSPITEAVRKNSAPSSIK